MHQCAAIVAAHGLLLAAAHAAAITPASRPPLVEAFGRVPLTFERNNGQASAKVDFLSRGPGYSLFLSGGDAVLSVGRQAGQRPGAGPAAPPTAAVLRLRCRGANRPAHAEGLEPQATRSSYFAGNDPSRWRTNVPHFGKVRYADVYPGIDLVYYGNQRQLEFDFVVEPGADPRRIRLEFAGAERLELDPSGDLVVHVGGSAVRQKKPIAYQERDGVRQVVQADYVLEGRDRASFRLGPYDRGRRLVVDPVVVYSTYLGGSRDDWANAVAVDAEGNVYVAGTTFGDFPEAVSLVEDRGPSKRTPAPADISGPYSDVFVTKLNRSGTAIVYSVCLRGYETDYAYGLAVDADGNAYVTGSTTSGDFPVTFPVYQSRMGGIEGFEDVFVTKINPTGTGLVYSTYLGGAMQDFGYAIAVDGTGHAYVTGYTSSADFPSLGFKGGLAGGGAFATKLNAAGTALDYSAYLGGAYGNAIAVDSAGHAYVAGSASGPFPTENPIRYCGSLYPDAFVSKLNPAGGGLVYSTCLGGMETDGALGIAVDAAGSAYVAGHTRSPDFPTTAGVVQRATGGIPEYFGADAFVTKLTPSGSGLVYSTYLGGSQFDGAAAIAVDGAGSAYVAGYTNSADFPVANAVQGTMPPSGGSFVARLSPAADALVYSTFLGGSRGDQAMAIALDASRNVHVAGYAASTDLPTVRALQPTIAGAPDAFVVKISGAWHEWFAVNALETPEVGDFNGDGRTDIITFTRQNPSAVGDVYVALSNGHLFVDKNGTPDSSDKWHDWFAVTTDERVVIGDFDGDGKDDIATWLATTTRQAYVALSTGTGMSHETVWAESIGFDPSDVLLAGDVDGDGKDDLVCFARKQGKVYVALSTGTSFGAPKQWHGYFAVSTYERPRVADVNGDGKADIVTFATDSPTAQGDVYVALSNGTAFVDQNGVPNSSTKWHDWFAVQPSEQVRIGDIDGDTKQDFFTFLPPPFAQCYTVRSEGTQMGPNVLWPDPVAPAAGDVPFVGDVNGDKKADVIVFARREGKVYVSLGR